MTAAARPQYDRARPRGALTVMPAARPQYDARGPTPGRADRDGRRASAVRRVASTAPRRGARQDPGGVAAATRRARAARAPTRDCVARDELARHVARVVERDVRAGELRSRGLDDGDGGGETRDAPARGRPSEHTRDGEAGDERCG